MMHLHEEASSQIQHQSQKISTHLKLNSCLILIVALLVSACSNSSETTSKNDAAILTADNAFRMSKLVLHAAWETEDIFYWMLDRPFPYFEEMEGSTYIAECFPSGKQTFEISAQDTEAPLETEGDYIAFIFDECETNYGRFNGEVTKTYDQSGTTENGDQNFTLEFNDFTQSTEAGNNNEISDEATFNGILQFREHWIDNNGTYELTVESLKREGYDATGQQSTGVYDFVYQGEYIDGEHELYTYAGTVYIEGLGRLDVQTPTPHQISHENRDYLRVAGLTLINGAGGAKIQITPGGTEYPDYLWIELDSDADGQYEYRRLYLPEELF